MHNPLAKNNDTSKLDSTLAEMITSVESMNTVLELLPKLFENLSPELQLAFFQHNVVSKFMFKAYAMNCIGSAILAGNVDDDNTCQCDVCKEDNLDID